MNPEAVYTKTDKGREELTARRYGLPQSLRFALILVDGRSTLAQLLNKGAGLPNLGESLQMLLEMDFIQTSGGPGVASRSTVPESAPGASQAVAGGKQELIELARRLLREQAGKVVRKLEDCEDSPAGLRVALDGCYKLIKLTIDERRAEEFIAAGRQILAK